MGDDSNIFEDSSGSSSSSSSGGNSSSEANNGEDRQQQQPSRSPSLGLVAIAPRQSSASSSSPLPSGCGICGELMAPGGVGGVGGGLTRHMMGQHPGCGIPLEDTLCGGLLGERVENNSTSQLFFYCHSQKS